VNAGCISRSKAAVQGISWDLAKLRAYDADHAMMPEIAVKIEPSSAIVSSTWRERNSTPNN